MSALLWSAVAASLLTAAGRILRDDHQHQPAADPGGWDALIAPLADDYAPATPMPGGGGD